MSDEDWLEDVAGQGTVQDPLVDTEWTRLQNKYNDAGYREGITDGKLSTLQQGFDQGFALATPFARQIGALRGQATALLQFLSNTSSGAAIEDEVRDLVRDLGRVRRDDILPVDEEREAHEEEDRLARGEEGFELDPNDKRDMEGLEQALEGVTSSSGQNGTNARWDGRKGQELVDQLRMRLDELQARAIRS